MTDKVFIIAEAGVNHNGSLDTAFRLVDAAVQSGADAIKFQTFRTEALVSANAEKAGYQKKFTEDTGTRQFDLLKKLELDEDAHRELQRRCESLSIEFLSTPFDLASARFLVEQLNLPRLKVSSGDLTNAPFLYQLARFGRPLILSSGMALLADIELALGVLAHGFIGKDAPSLDAFRAAYCSDAGQAAIAENVSLLHCTTEYPAAPETINLRAMDTLAQSFGLVTGFSDHSEGLAVPFAAVARGARIIEKHFTLDRNLPGPDHRASLEPIELKALVEGIRQIESALGNATKRTGLIEEGNRQVACKSILASHAIKAGDIFSPENLAVKRPLGGLAPVEWWNLIGRPARRCYAIDEPIVHE